MIASQAASFDGRARRRIRALALALSLTTVIAAASPAAADPWDRIYAGFQTGTSTQRTTWDTDFGQTRYAALGEHDPMAGIFAGGTKLFGHNFVAGGEFGFNWLNANVNEGNGAPTAFTSDMQFEFAARAGFLVTPDTYLYARAGIAPYHIIAHPERFFASAEDSWRVAGIAGVGMETRVTSRINLRTEALYTRTLYPLYLEDNLQRIEPSFFTIRAGVSVALGSIGEETARLAAPTTDWTGFNFGLFASGNGVSHRFDHFDLDSGGPFSDIDIGGGAFVGYDRQVAPRMVVGAELSGDWLGLATRDLFATVDMMRIPWSAAVTGRVGYLTNPSTMIYARAGYAMLHTEATEDYFFGDAVSENLGAFVVGGGIEARVTPHVSVRVEGSVTKAVDDLEIALGGIPNADAFKPTVISGRTGLAVHF